MAKVQDENKVIENENNDNDKASLEKESITHQVLSEFPKNSDEHLKATIIIDEKPYDTASSSKCQNICYDSVCCNDYENYDINNKKICVTKSMDDTISSESSSNAHIVPDLCDNENIVPEVTDNEVKNGDKFISEEVESISKDRSSNNENLNNFVNSEDLSTLELQTPKKCMNTFHQDKSYLQNTYESVDESKETDMQRYIDCIQDLKKKIMDLEREVFHLNNAISNQELTYQRSEQQTRAEFLGNIEKLSKDCNILRKEKEAMVVKYANSEKEVINEKKIQIDLERRLKEMLKDRENLQLKIKNLSSENSRLSSSCESKLLEIAKLQKNLDRFFTDANTKDVKIKWLQNKLRLEIESHQETHGKYESTLHRLNERKEEAEQIRKDCQDMIKCYQEAEEIKSVKLDGQLKQKLSELEVQKQEKCDQEQVFLFLKHELEALKKKQRVTMEENNSLTLKINNLEKERLEYEQNLSKQKDNQNLLKEEVVDLTARLAEMETLRLQLEREKDKSAASLREVDRLRSTNAELQADMNSCHKKEGELLKFTEGVTDTNVKLQSAHTLLEVKAQAIEEELSETKEKLVESQQKYFDLLAELENNVKEHGEEVQLLVRKLAEKTKNVEKLNTKLDESENENRVLKRRHIASIKELSRELYECKRKLDMYDSSSCIRAESASLGSRSSSTASLDASNSNENKCSTSSENTVSTLNSKQSSNNDQSTTSFPEIDKEMLIERIIKLQKTLARKNDKIDFLEDHIVQLVKEMRKKNKNVDLKNV